MMLLEKKTKCAFCKNEFEIISQAHIKKCSNGKYDYDKYVKKYGRFEGEFCVYSEKYRNRLIKSNSERDESYKIKLSNSARNWWKTNKLDHSNRLKIAQNTEIAKENHRNGYLKYCKNMTNEQRQQRSESAKRTWKDKKIREKRISAINTEESIKARKIGGRKAAISTLKKCPKISKIQRKFSENLKLEGIDNILEHVFGFYSIDIAKPELKFAIEVDGDYWHGNPKFYKKNDLNKTQKDRISRDKARNTYMRNRGWVVLRFWEDDLKRDMCKCVNIVKKTILELENGKR